MSLNKVRVAEGASNGATSLTIQLFPEERIISATFPVEFEYEYNSGYPGSGLQIIKPKGTLFLTNIRVVFLPPKSTASFQSFAAPIQNLEDAKVSEHWIRGSTYSCACRSVQDEGIANEWGRVKFVFDKNHHAADFNNALTYQRSQMGTIPAQYVEELPSYHGVSEHAPGSPSYFDSTLIGSSGPELPSSSSSMEPNFSGSPAYTPLNVPIFPSSTSMEPNDAGPNPILPSSSSMDPTTAAPPPDYK